jgi:hypothetical protein
MMSSTSCRILCIEYILYIFILQNMPFVLYFMYEISTEAKLWNQSHDQVAAKIHCTTLAPFVV